MLQYDKTRIDPKRRAGLDFKRRQFATPTYKQQDYPHRLNFYEVPPTAEITLEQFEQWAIDRLRILSEFEACSYRNKTPSETAAHIAPLLQKFLPLHSNTASGSGVDQRLRDERQKDHYSHFILRLAFSSTDELRRRFVRLETMLFKFRFQEDDSKERRAFVDSLNFDWDIVSDEEKHNLGEALLASTPGIKRLDNEGWFKFTSKALPRLDEDDRLVPILDHLSKNFGTSDTSYIDGEGAVPGAPITAASIDALSSSFPLCMRNLHMQLRKNAHLKHFGRLQYTLFLKGIGLSLEDCIMFWRQSFRNFSDDEFNSKYKYNIRHAYGDVGGDSNRRGRGYPPYSCQKILTDNAPGAGQTHGCPYRHFSVDNLIALLQVTGVNDRDVLQGVREDVGRMRYHIACNRVFEHVHKDELKKAKDEGIMSPAELDTIVHPNTYFKRSYQLKNLGKLSKADVEMTA
ncbi:DNA primase subunit pri2 [Ophidiomyces ophidiicola]|uniref:DNA primase subunit pri2 n=1 Tax=Ophidiomyces ophidiicola TaxID=1387563 RepID=A0ACB8UM12_9EURO|nr:DNA primase subunit pri2 [Ophidiomyces ophidiicola]KAI1910605.1 DNA primase subunit pri2 [Ophidiomyces ophidiicola]KAI1916334.1 DNA primase subunit pri2 [Ophidiomyces ophidiicola]KAI1930671.1 DNA primase subunit pri2 [Ophidiomyces ophidiicola]KAI1936064.1 DNA primase subunit pri2 [Ophidiomyces ophidiicola]KAI1955416.1 DNA primase subunit pri2 [Ophidiomyces ophidiicola]